MNNDTRIEWEVVYRMGPRTYSQDCKQLEDGTIDCLWGRKKNIDDVIAFLKYENHYVDNDSIEVYKLTYRAESTYRYPSYGMDGKISGHNDAPRYRLVSREKYYPKALREDIAGGQYLVLYFEELRSFTSTNELNTIEPVYTLSEWDIDNEEGVVYVNGKEEFPVAENNNFEDDPQAGDLVFEVFGEPVIYRPGVGTVAGTEECMIGTAEEIQNNLNTYAKEYREWYGYRPRKNTKMKITENSIRKIIRESLYEIAKVPRGGNFLATVQNLIAQANNAYNEAVQKCEDDTPLMDREGDSYGLVGQIVLTKTGVVKFTLKYALSREPETHVVKVMSIKRNGDVVPIQGDYWEEGWKDVRKILNGIIKDAQRGMQYFTNYDPSIEELPAKQGKQAMRDFNKSIGRVPTAGTDIF